MYSVKDRTMENLIFIPNHLVAVTYTTFLTGFRCIVFLITWRVWMHCKTAEAHKLFSNSVSVLQDLAESGVLPCRWHHSCTVGAFVQVLYLFRDVMAKLTCVGLQVLWGHHYNKADCPFIAKHLISPAADGPHAFDRCNAIVGNKHLEKQVTNVDLFTFTLIKSINKWLIRLQHERSWNMNLASTVFSCWVAQANKRLNEKIISCT